MTVYIFVIIHVPYVHNPESACNILRTRLKKGNGRLEKQAMEVARLVNDEENGSRFEV